MMRRPSACSAARMSWNSTRPVSARCRSPRARFGLDGLEHEVGRVDLAVRVRVGDADDLALVLEDEHVIDAVACAEIAVLLLPDLEQPVDLGRLQLRQRQVVARAVADDARHARRGPVAVDARGRREHLRRERPHARDDRCRRRRCRYTAGCARRSPARCPGTDSSPPRTAARQPQPLPTSCPIHGRSCRCAATITHSSRSGCQRSSQTGIGRSTAKAAGGSLEHGGDCRPQLATTH